MITTKLNNQIKTQKTQKHFEKEMKESDKYVKA